MTSVLKNTIGVVACGGKSSRMGFDKSLIGYFGKPQRTFLMELLAPYCDSLCLSCNPEQVMDPDAVTVVDLEVFTGLGPMTGLLSVYQSYPGSNILLLGCDYPYLSQDELAGFVHHCNKFNATTAFFDEDSDLYEPLIAWYCKDDIEMLLKQFKNKSHSLQFWLRELGAGKYFPSNKMALQSINLREDMAKAMKFLNPSC